ncbi:hypothetical protein N0V88_002052 [Collariella sp. IMI 366227]|nr:hypothetical protein N0V88_002052 [Collariella sp. IMI 366227]
MQRRLLDGTLGRPFSYFRLPAAIEQDIHDIVDTVVPCRIAEDDTAEPLGIGTDTQQGKSITVTTTRSPLPLSYGNLQAAQQHPYLYNNMPAFNRNSMFLPTQLSSQAFHPEAHQFENPPPLLSQGLFRMLQSNADPHSAHSHYADLSDPPDLYASLHEEQLPPPPEDMNPSDPDLVPHEQDLRFEGDLYTPRWVRGHGNKREGWCGICKPGRWLVLKNSAFWYDKSFSHGISAATGSSFQEPRETRRMDGNPDERKQQPSLLGCGKHGEIEG